MQIRHVGRIFRRPWQEVARCRRGGRKRFDLPPCCTMRMTVPRLAWIAGWRAGGLITLFPPWKCAGFWLIYHDLQTAGALPLIEGMEDAFTPPIALILDVPSREQRGSSKARGQRFATCQLILRQALREQGLPRMSGVVFFFGERLHVNAVDGQNFAPPKKPWLKPLFVGICRGLITNQGF